MEKTQDYVVNSLEQHLFFARIMKEHAFFLKVGFLPPNSNMANEGDHLFRQFEALLSRAITLSNCVVRSYVLDSGEIVTEFTDCAERQTQKLTGTLINRELTTRAKQLKGRNCNDELCVSQALVHQVRRLNQDALALLDHLIKYKERILEGVKCCSLFTANYPLLIEHILREARLYRAYLLHQEGSGDCDCQELQNSELFWNQIMMEHALFIRRLLDPSENTLIDAADGFAADYKNLLEAAAAANNKTMCGCENALELTQKFRDFKQAGVEGISTSLPFSSGKRICPFFDSIAVRSTTSVRKPILSVAQTPRLTVPCSLSVLPTR